MKKLRYDGHLDSTEVGFSLIDWPYEVRIQTSEAVRMKIRFLLFCALIGVLPFLATNSRAQLWSGVVSPNRAIDWSNAGTTIPSRTTQCGTTIAPYSGSAATINNAIAACPSGQFVSLGAGTFNLSSGIDFQHHSNVTLRGQGANSTLISFSGAGAGGYNSDVAMEGSVSAAGYENNVCDWTAGYAPGTRVITLANCGSTTPAAGSLNNLKVGTLLVLDQVDEAADTGSIWNCATANVCSNIMQGGESRTNGPSVNGVSLRSQEQGVVVTGISGNQITISPGLYMPNWRSGQAPQAYFANTTATGDGLENLTVNNTPEGTASGQNITIANCVGCWVKGVRSIDADRSHVRLILTSHAVVRDSYFYANASHLTVSYGAEMFGAWDGIFENNIFQQNSDSEPSCSGACEGNVVAYNFNIDNVYETVGWFQAGFYQHAAGDSLNLWEGNIGPGYTADDVHGTHHFETMFRNRLQGWQASCNGTTCTAQTIPIHLYVGSRYFNVIGNVLGQTGFHPNYTCNAQSTATCTYGTDSIYDLGYSGNSGGVFTNVVGYCTSPACTSHAYYDPQVAAYLMRWGNYDTVHGSNQFNSNEVPSNIASYSNPVPASQALPASFYLTSKPSWWQNEPWPAIGPDVSNGNLGRCSGGSYDGELATSSSQCATGTLVTDVSGRANSTPAMDCALKTMGMPPDGSGGLLSFDAGICYGTSTTTTPPPSPSGLTGTVTTN